MKNKELDFDIKIGLNKVEENITNLTDKERERVISDLENGMGPDDIILYMNQFRGNVKNLDSVSNLFKSGLPVLTAVKITKKYRFDDELETVFMCMENGMPIAVIEKEYSKKSFISRMKSYMDSLEKDKIENKKIKQPLKEKMVKDKDDKIPEGLALAVGNEMMKRVNLYIPFLKEPYETYVGRIFMKAADLILERIPSIQNLNINIFLNQKMAMDLIDYILNCPEEKLDTAALERACKDGKFE